MEGIIKYLMCFLFGFLAYNEFVLMNRESSFNQLGHHADKGAVAASIGEPQHSYRCGSGEQPASFLAYIDSLCKDNVEEVDAYPLCRLPVRCRGWNYVGYDAKGRLLVKYRLAN